VCKERAVKKSVEHGHRKISNMEKKESGAEEEGEKPWKNLQASRPQKLKSPL